MTRDEFDTEGKSIHQLILEVKRLQRDLRVGNRRFREMVNHVVKLAAMYPETGKSLSRRKGRKDDSRRI